MTWVAWDHIETQIEKNLVWLKTKFLSKDYICTAVVPDSLFLLY